jgi:PDZ domain-containing protein
VAIFTDGQAPRPRDGRVARRVGWIILAVAIVGLVVFGASPAPYAIEKPGPVFNTTGTTIVDKKTVPVISIPNKTTYSTNGALDMLTVNVTGDPTNPPSWVQIALAWFDPSQAVVPMDELYAPQQTLKQSNAESTVEMTESQQDATAAALTQQGIRFTSVVAVVGTQKGSPAAAVLKKGDVVQKVNGAAFPDTDALHRLVVANGTSKPLSIEFKRGGSVESANLTPALSPGADPAPYIGVFTSQTYHFPFAVKIQLQDVGGPSAGQMFALGIIDKLTPGELTGGQHIAGTGTITASGQVGAIGGIRQKMYGARAAGAKYFLAPKSNCGGSDGVVGHIPSGLRVFATSTLKQSLTALKAISTGRGLDALPTCGNS